MPTEWNRLLARLSRADLQRLLEAKSEIEELETRRSSLLKELADIERSLKQLAAGASSSGGRGAKRVTKAARAKKTAGKQVAGKGRPRRAKAKPKAKVNRTASKTTGVRSRKVPDRAGGRLKLEDVVIAVLQEHGEPMPFKVLFETIVKGKRFKSRSKNFDNVLRRTLSASKRIKRKARGVYEV